MSQSDRLILVVDDDQDICASMKDVLDDVGYHTDVASDGPQALALVSEQRYDLALLDFKMPGMDGVTLYQEMKKIHPELVAILITAYAGNDGVEKARAAGTWDVLRKPVDFGTLLPMIASQTLEHRE